MDSFEALGLGPEVVEALAAEGIERPTALQAAAVPVVARGHNLVAVAGPGAGTLAAWAAPLFDRVEPGGGHPTVLVAVPTGEVGEALADSLGRIAQHTGHAIAVIAGPWALPERADVVFGTPGQLAAATGDGRVDPAAVRAAVVVDAASIEALGVLQTLEGVLELLPAEAQRIIVTLPETDGVRALVRARVPRATHVPPQPAAAEDEGPVVERGDLHYHVAAADRERATLEIVARRLTDGDARHAVVFCRSEDRAADVGDYLTQHGFLAGAPGDDSAPVWIAVDALEARAAITASPDPDAVITVSCDVPADEDTLDRRHSAGGDGIIVVLPREVDHLKATAFGAGYRLRPLPLEVTAVPRDIARLRARIEEAAEQSLGAEMLILAPLFERFDAAAVAAAVLRLLREQGTDTAATRTAPPATQAAEGAAGARPFVRLYVGAGHRDGVSPREVLGALSGESGVRGNYFGRIDIRDTFTLVEVDPAVAGKVISAANGVNIRGRAARVDYDRGSREKPGGRPRGGPPRKSGRPRT